MCCDIVFVKQPSGDASVLCQDQIHGGQDLDSAMRDVAQVSDGSGDNVEHRLDGLDLERIRFHDHVIDLGPGAGIHGGKIVAEGPPSEILKSGSLTARYLSGELQIMPLKRREGNGKSILLNGASGNNLRNVSVEFPLGKLICVTGVSGSGKSTLINETLYPILNQYFYRSHGRPLPYKSGKA